MKQGVWTVCIVFFLILSCVRSSSENERQLPQEICNSWIGEIEEDGVKGSQILIFSDNNEFQEIKKITYASEDSGFDFSIPCSVSTHGEWKLSKDTLYLKYSPKVSVAPDADSFMVKAVGAKDTTYIPEDVKSKMATDMSRFLITNISEQFKSVADQYYPLGVVKGIERDLLIIDKNGVTVRFKRNNY